MCYERKRRLPRNLSQNLHMIAWQDIFRDMEGVSPDELDTMDSLASLRRFLDVCHVRHCLVKPFQEVPGYPIVESRELLPSFDCDMFEYAKLPGFAMVAFGRQLDYFSEIFQYDKLHTIPVDADGFSCPLENVVTEQNIQTLAERLPRCCHRDLRATTRSMDLTRLENYPRLLPYLLEMDRAHVFAHDSTDVFHLAGVFASFPSDMDSEVKRFGIRIGKFAHGDSAMYERNRMFVYQYLMELSGFPIVSERRTASALFARKLHRMGENFLLRVMGQSDRAITTYMNMGENRHYPRLDKMALVAVDRDQKEALELIGRKGYFLDEERRVVIMRITYRQHGYDPANVRQDRALSVATQEILHPLSGRPLPGLNIIKDASNIFLRLNDIVRGEYTGRIIYKRSEIVENTDTDEKRLKFLHSWLVKHQRRMISYSDEFYGNAEKVIESYLKAPQKAEVFDSLRELYQDVQARISYIKQARRVRILEDLSKRLCRGKRIGYLQMSREVLELLNDQQFAMADFFPELVDSIVGCGDAILHDRYLQRHYVEPPESSLSPAGVEIRKNYGRIVATLDRIKAVSRTRAGSGNRKISESV